MQLKQPGVQHACLTALMTDPGFCDMLKGKPLLVSLLPPHVPRQQWQLRYLKFDRNGSRCFGNVARPLYVNLDREINDC